MIRVMSDTKKELRALNKKIAALEKEVEEAKLRESMVEVAEEMGYPIKQKLWEDARKKLAEMKNKGES